ncbi:hypothetical protein FSP39_007805 [Pinctada imbricata]|uniref:PID domain-containing protein n=1 Tax=Pinctada imbricata TaxID=66713 RepID=A0AA88YE91_PINIB|nr:hypothetical protein FSP39_007805 [Pinctada imbricata]
MFNSATKVRASITETDPVFKGRYLGFTETFVASGTGCTIKHVQTMWDNAGSEKHMKKVVLVLNTSGILMKEEGKKKDRGQHFPIENISFCNADANIERVFSWICKEEDSPKLLCHAVLCSDSEGAKAMSLVMSRAFQIAYKEWKTHKSRELRESRKGKVPEQIIRKQSNNSVLTGDTVSASGSEHESESGFSGIGKTLSERRESENQTDIDNVSSILRSSLNMNGSLSENQS